MTRTGPLACGFAALVLLACRRDAAPPRTAAEVEDAPARVEAPAVAPPTPVPADDTKALATEYRALRSVPGHFGGGEWDDSVDRFGGRKHVLLGELGERLGDGHHTRAEIESLLGPPDDVLRRGDTMFGAALGDREPRATELLVYRWRGLHDFLYFASDGARVLSSGWWFAWE